jgi:hypothetical protein
MENFEIASADHYCSDYGRLGDALGVAGVVPAPGELEFLRSVMPPGRPQLGMLPRTDFFFRRCCYEHPSPASCDRNRHGFWFFRSA